MKKTTVPFLSALLIGLSGFLYPAVRQVRVTAERAAIYIEPSRSSSRIDIVTKGTLLNLFQEQKVKNIWYYVSYNSRRYGSRMSGFILDTAVEPVLEGEPAAEKPISPALKIETARKAEEPPPEPAQRPAAKAAGEPEKAEVRPALKPELPKDKPKAAEPDKSPGVLTTPAPPPAPKPDITKEKPKIVEYGVVTGITPTPRSARLSLPRRTLTPQDYPWAIIQPPITESEKAPAISPTPAIPTPSKIREAPPEKKAPVISKPATAEPDKAPSAPTSTPPAPQVASQRPARIPSPGRRPARLAFGFGFGPSFGGAGGSLQLYLSRSLALHAGYGVYPTTVIYSETDWVKNETFWSAGLRLSLMPSSEKLTPYLDAQYGGLRVEAAQVITGIYEYSYIYSYEQKVLWGPSLLAGLEVRFGRFVLSGGLGVSYSLTDWEYLESRVFFAFEAGLGVRL